MNKKTSKEIWAVVDSAGEVCYSRGGSSTEQKLMVYPTEIKAKAALRNIWTQQILKADDVKVKKIYESGRI